MGIKKDYNFSYKKSGVDVKKADKLLDKVKPLIASTKGKNNLGDIGGFGGLFKINSKQYKNPLLVAATDGVGSKLLIAKQLNNFNTIGIDLVAMSVNDVIVQGARPLFFLDYLAIDKLKENMFIDIIKGIVKGCKESNCSLIGGETAELPSVYPKGGYDLAGFCLGILEKRNLLPNGKIKVGDILFALPSSGIHANGFSLIRKIIKDKRLSLSKIIYSNTSLGKSLIKPTKIYVKPILNALKVSNDINAIAHITGGGIINNLKRVIPNDLGFYIYKSKLAFYKKHNIFYWLKNECKLREKDLIETFNCGFGMILVVKKNNKEQLINIFKGSRQPIIEIGKITPYNESSFI